IGFNLSDQQADLPAATDATLVINDAQGRLLHTIKVGVTAGYNTIHVAKDMIQNATGILTYTLTSGEYKATKKMIVIE
ncbi:MAG: T9SS type A sorting domain-containing protein, partial [Bacteroidota bacterium]